MAQQSDCHLELRTAPTLLTLIFIGDRMAHHSSPKLAITYNTAPAAPGDDAVRAGVPVYVAALSDEHPR